MITIIEDTADKMECRDQEVFVNIIMHEALSGRMPKLRLRDIRWQALKMYREWLRNRTIDQATEDFCLMQLVHQK